MNNIGIIGCNYRENITIGKSLYGNPEIKVYYIGNHANKDIDELGYIYDNIDITDPNQILEGVRNIN